MYRVALTAMLLAPAGLLPAQVEVTSATGSAEAAYVLMTEEYSAAMTEYRRIGTEARQRGETIDAESPIVTFLPRFQKAAADHAGTEDAVQFLSWIALNAGSNADAATAAMKTLAADHIDSDGWAAIAPRLSGMSRTLGEELVGELTARLLAESPSATVKAELLFARGNQVIRDAYNEPAPDDKRAAAIADLRKVCELVPDSETAGKAERGLFELEHLRNGMPAPEIVAEDLDGVEFKLSDYRGKVVVLDFWGDW